MYLVFLAQHLESKIVYDPHIVLYQGYFLFITLDHWSHGAYGLKLCFNWTLTFYELCKNEEGIVSQTTAKHISKCSRQLQCSCLQVSLCSVDFSSPWKGESTIVSAHSHPTSCKALTGPHSETFSFLFYFVFAWEKEEARVCTPRKTKGHKWQMAIDSPDRFVVNIVCLEKPLCEKRCPLPPEVSFLKTWPLR